MPKHFPAFQLSKYSGNLINAASRRVPIVAIRYGAGLSLSLSLSLPAVAEAAARSPSRYRRDWGPHRSRHGRPDRLSTSAGGGATVQTRPSSQTGPLT